MSNNSGASPEAFKEEINFDNMLVELRGLTKEELNAVALDAMFIESDVVSLDEIHSLEHGAGARWCRQETPCTTRMVM